MADRGHELTDELLKELEKRVAMEYSAALKEAEEKVRVYFEQLDAKAAEQRQLVEEGKITLKDYRDWYYRHTMIGKRWAALRDALAEDMHHANVIALGIARGRMPDVYALNHNYSLYTIEHDGEIDTGLALYNRETAAYLLEQEERELMPGPSEAKSAEIAANKDLQWNRQKIQSALFQGIMLGDSPYDMARRLQSVAQMNYNSAVRYARTMTTSVQNAGRYEAFREADSLGVDLTIEWQATLDNRTRHDHRLMHGQRRAVNEPFITPDGFFIQWPAKQKYGSSDVPQKEIWNCRCTLLSWVKGLEGDTVTSSPKMGDMTFEEWLNAKAIPDTAADRKQFAEYKKLLGKDAPKYYTDFQQIKHNDPDKWAWLKDQARMERTIRSAPCVLTKQKYSGYFLKPGAKHAEDFFSVGYTPRDVRRLRYDMSQRFDAGKAVWTEKNDDGTGKFNIGMLLGVEKERTFLTVWQIDEPGGRPRIITSYRVSADDKRIRKS